jgi:hypothetical protein
MYAEGGGQESRANTATDGKCRTLDQERSQ